MQPRGLVAVIDDEALVRKALERLLRLEGFVVESHASAMDFLHSLHDRRPDCLLLDVHMPGMDGFELLEALRTMALKMPAIVVSADCSPPVIHRARSLGALQCLSKPVDESILMDAISAALRTSRK